MRDAPLAGITVLELCQNVAGPFGGLILSQFGADVVKVERPGSGDDTRAWAPPSWGDESVMFAAMNAGKRSITLDLDDEDDRRELVGVAAEVDVLLASLRPASLKRRGLGYDDLVEVNPRLVYCSLSGFGSVGPLADAPGYDPLVQAFSGLMSVTGEPEGRPVRAGTSLVDMGTGMWAVMACIVALRQRDATGRGTHIQTSLLETGLGWLPYQIAGYLATGSDPARMGSGLGMLVPYQAFDTRDEMIVIAAGNDALWQRLCHVLGRTDLAEDPDLATNPQRVARREMVVGELQRTLVKRSAAEWGVELRAADVPCSPVQRISEVVAHPQTAALGMLVDVAHPSIEDFRLLGLPVTLDGWRPVPTGPPPPLSPPEAPS